MNYTNGFDADLVLPALAQRLGWTQPTLANSPVLTTPNTTSASGRYFNDGSFHATATVNNLKQSQEDLAISDDNFNIYLANLQNSLILRSLNEVFREKELLEQALLYTRYGVNDIPIVNGTDFVGYVIQIANDKSIATKIEFATLYFNADVTFPMYLYEDGVQTPVLTFNVTVQAWQRTQVEFDGSSENNPEIVLKFVRGRRYYFGYYQSDLGEAQAIREQVDQWATTFCFEAYPFSAPFDPQFGFVHNYRQFPFLPGGVNLEMISFRDHTEKIIGKANLFDELQGLQMAAYILEAINNSTRINQTQRLTEQQSQQTFMELNQAFPTKDVPVTAGIKSRIGGEFKRLKDTFFPKIKAISLPQQGTNSWSQLDKQWNDLNKQTITNPPAGIIP